MSGPDSQSARLLDVAALTFARLGYAGASVRIIAEAADMNAAMVAYYFDSKEGLFRAILKALDSRIRERLAWAEKSAAPGPARKEARQRAYWNCVVVENPAFIHLVWSQALLAGNGFPHEDCRALASEHADLVDAPEAFQTLAVEMLSEPVPLMDRPEQERQALADKLSPSPGRRSPRNARQTSSSPRSAVVEAPIAPEPSPPPQKPEGDDFLDGFLD